MITDIATDDFNAYVATTFDRCAADMDRLGLTWERIGLELRSKCGALTLRLEWVERAAWGWTVSASAYGYNIWGKTQPLTEALEMARRNLQIMSLAVQWDAELAALRFAEADISDPVKVAAYEERRELANAITDGVAQVSTERRREVVSRVRDGQKLPSIDAALARKMPLVIERGDDGYHLTKVGEHVAELVKPGVHRSASEVV